MVDNTREGQQKVQLWMNRTFLREYDIVTCEHNFTTRAAAIRQAMRDQMTKLRRRRR